MQLKTGISAFAFLLLSAFSFNANAETLDGKAFLWNWRDFAGGNCSYSVVSDGRVSLSNTVWKKTRELLVSCGVSDVKPDLGALWSSAEHSFENEKSGWPKRLKANGVFTAGFKASEDVVFDLKSLEMRFEFEALKDGVPTPSLGGFLGRSNVPVSALNFAGEGPSGAFKGKLLEIIERPFEVQWLEAWPLCDDRLVKIEALDGCLLKVQDAKTREAPVFNLSEYRVLRPAQAPTMNKGDKLSLALKVSLRDLAEGRTALKSFPVQVSTNKDWRDVLPPCAAPEKLFSVEASGRQAPVYSLGEKAAFNISAKDAALAGAKLDAKISDCFSGAALQSSVVELADGKGVLSFAPSAPSAYCLELSPVGEPKRSERFEFAVAGPIPQKEAVWSAMPAALNKRLVDEIDFSDPADKHPKHSHGGEARIAKRSFGSYWESAVSPTRYDAPFISARFEIKNPSAPHLIEIDYPDDRDRNMGFSVGEVYAAPDAKDRPLTGRATGGVVTGAPYAVSKTMKTWSSVYFPVKKEAFVQATSNTPNWPAAISKIRVYELPEGLPALKVAQVDGKPRETMQHWERVNIAFHSFDNDPRADVFSNRGRGEFRPHLFYTAMYRTFSNLVQYLRYRGDNSLEAGIFMYSNWFLLPGEEGVWTRNDAWELLGRMFAANGLKLMLSTEFIYSPALLASHVSGDAEVAAGARTMMPVSNEGKQDSACWAGKFANPLSPEYRDAMSKHLETIASRYAKTPGIEGVNCVMFAPFFSMFGDKSLKGDSFLKYSYDDLTISQFERWRGAPLPLAASGPDRFAKRSEWIRKNARAEWIKFIDLSIRDVNRELAQALQRKAPSWRYAVSPIYGGVYDDENCYGGAASPEDLFAQLGYDPELYRSDRWVSLCLPLPIISDAKSRAQDGANPARSKLVMDKLSDPAHCKWIGGSAPGSFNWTGNTFYESYKRNISDSWLYNNRSADMVEYTEPSGQLALHSFAELMAFGDPGSLVYQFCDVRPFMGGEDVYQRNFSAFRALPDVPFAFASAPQRDKVSLRFASCGGKSFFYAVNPGLSPAKLEIATGAASVVDLSDGSTLDCPGGTLTLNLEPCGFRAFSGGNGKPALLSSTLDAKGLLSSLEKDCSSLIADAKTRSLDVKEAEADLEKAKLFSSFDQALDFLKGSRALAQLKAQVERLELGGWTWRVLGPMPCVERRQLDIPLVNESGVPDFSASLDCLYGGKVSWRSFVGGKGNLDFSELYPDLAERSVSYACLVVRSPEEKDLTLSLGSDDGAKVWVNGVLVHSNRAVRGAARGQEKAPVHLKKGANFVLFKIDNVAGSYQLIAEFLKKDGSEDKSLLFVEADAKAVKECEF